MGLPRFKDVRAQALASQGNLAGAWQQACRGRLLNEALAEVEGSFAAAFTDERGRTVLCVDRFAIQSLCYRVADGALHFAANADQLAGAEAHIDAQAIFDYLYFHVIPSPRTVYKGVVRLPPGHRAVFENGQLDVQPYWKPSFSEDTDPSFPALKSRFLALTREAVARQFGGGRPACFLSGGTDSSSVAGMLAQLGVGRPATYSIGFDAQGYDEMAYARMAAKQFGTEHHEYYVTPNDLARGIPLLAAHFDQPFGNSSCLPAYYCAKMAKDDGVDKLLAGDGGDELFGGNARYAKQRVFSWYGKVPGILKSGIIEPIVSLPGAEKLTLARKAGSYVDQARRPMPDRLQLYNLLMRLGPAEVLSPAFLAQVDPAAPLQLQRQVWQQVGACSDLNRELAYDWRFTLAESDLPKVNAATSLAGVQVGYPMLDDDLLAFSLLLPTAYKLKGMQLRWFFKEALRGFLPDAIIEKKKHGFGLPFGVWANSHAGLKALARDALGSLAARGVVRADFVNTLIAQRLAEHPGYYGEMVWILMMLEQWLQAKKPDFRVE
jgi:asparagine synthase (glutamine-hydrolysing)